MSVFLHLFFYVSQIPERSGFQSPAQRYKAGQPFGSLVGEECLYLGWQKEHTQDFDNVKFKVPSNEYEQHSNGMNKPCSGYLRFAPKLTSLKHFIVLMVSVGQEFGQGTERMACLCSMKSRASAKKTQHLMGCLDT